MFPRKRKSTSSEDLPHLVTGLVDVARGVVGDGPSCSRPLLGTVLEEGVKLEEPILGVVYPSGKPLTRSGPPPLDVVLQGVLGDALVFKPQPAPGLLSHTDSVVPGVSRVVKVMVDRSLDVPGNTNGGPCRLAAEVMLGEGVQIPRNLVILAGLRGKPDNASMSEEAVGEIVHHVTCLASEGTVTSGLHRS